MQLNSVRRIYKSFLFLSNFNYFSQSFFCFLAKITFFFLLVFALDFLLSYTVGKYFRP